MSGVCPQHDVLYDNLNCIEHLEVYASLKNVPRQSLDNEVKLIRLFFEFMINFNFL